MAAYAHCTRAKWAMKMHAAPLPYETLYSRDISESSCVFLIAVKYVYFGTLTYYITKIGSNCNSNFNGVCNFL